MTIMSLEPRDILPAATIGERERGHRLASHTGLSSAPKRAVPGFDAVRAFAPLLAGLASFLLTAAALLLSHHS